MEQKKLSSTTFAKYGLAMAGQALACMIPLSYTNMFLTDGLLMTAVVAAGAITLFKALDFILALVCGVIVDKCNFKLGKYNTWIKFGQYAMFFGLVANFGDTSSLPLPCQLIIISIGYLLVQGSMNFVYTAVYGIVPILGGDDMDARSKLTTYGMIFMCAANIISNFTMTNVILWAQGIFGLAWGYCVAAALYTLPWFIFAGILSNEMKKYEHKRTPEEIAATPTISTLEMFSTMIKNTQLFVATLSWSVFYIGFYCSFGAITYFFMYVLGDIRYYSVAQGITTVFSFVASIICGKIGMKIGKKPSIVIGMLWMAASGVLIWLFGASNLTIYTILSCVKTIGMYLFYGFAANYMLDAGEWYLYKTGKDTRAVCSACFNLPVKFGTLFGGSIAAFGLAAIGYEAGITMDAAMKSQFMFIFGALGAVFIALAALIMLFGYKITDKDAAYYAEENKKRAEKVLADCTK